MPATIFIEYAADRAYSLVEPGGRHRRLECRHGINPPMSYSYLTFREPAQGVVQSGTEYKLKSRGTELKVETWHVVPDGSSN